MDNLYITLIVLAAVIGIFALLKHPKVKNFLTPENMAYLQLAIEISQRLVVAIKTNPEQRTKIQRILDIADLSTDYVDEMLKESDVNEKIIVATEATKQTLDKLGIVPTQEQLNLINITIKTSLEILE